jgi:ABC-type Fe3+-hydroxamate transport system substrate-binding protein
MPAFTDQLNNTTQLRDLPQRIVSLVPSQTELLYDLGLGERVTGITKFCVHPREWFSTKTRVGGTKSVNMAVIRSLAPDLIIANKEENVKEQVEALAHHYPVWTSDIHDLVSAYAMMEGIGLITGTGAAANVIINNIQSRFAQLPSPATTRRVAYLIWQNPFMTVGGDTFIHHLLQCCGWTNVFGSRRRYPVITAKELEAAQCDLLLLSSEPFPFKEKHVHEWTQKLPATKVILADGEMFSWYGSRLLHAPAYFRVLQEQVEG